MGEGRRIERIVIVGGGTAGWMAAISQSIRAGARRKRGPRRIAGGRERSASARRPSPRWSSFVRSLNLDEKEFMRRCSATYKLAIRFDGWAGDGTAYWHAFGSAAARSMASTCSISGSSAASRRKHARATRTFRSTRACASRQNRHGRSWRLVADRRDGRLRLSSRRGGASAIICARSPRARGCSNCSGMCRTSRVTTWAISQASTSAATARARRRSVHRRDRIFRAADRAGARRSLDRLVANTCCATAPWPCRCRGATSFRRYTLSRGHAGGLDVEDSAERAGSETATSIRARIFPPTRPTAALIAQSGLRRERSRRSAAASRCGSGGGQISGFATACRSALLRASSSRWNRPASISSRRRSCCWSNICPTATSATALRSAYNAEMAELYDEVRDFIVLH